MNLVEKERHRYAFTRTLHRLISRISVSHFNKLKFDAEIYHVCPDKLQPVINIGLERYDKELLASRFVIFNPFLDAT